MHQRHVISLLIHGFLSVNVRLLIALGTAFYAIIMVNFFVKFDKICSCRFEVIADTGFYF